MVYKFIANPKIDILIITYNHQDYISDSIESVLKQKHDFSYRINIADDFSTDKTREILIQYKNKYPEIINLILSEKNLGGKSNFINGTTYLVGDYITCLDGDDSWCDEYKLQKQISFLEKNPDFVGCANNNIILHKDGTKELKFKNKINDVYTIHDFLDGSISFHSSSILFRNVFNGKIPDLQKDKDAEDLFFTILHTEYGKIKYFDEIMSVYNLHQSGEWSSMNEEEQIRKTIKILTYAKKVLNNKYKKSIEFGIKKINKNLYKRITRNKNLKLSQKIIEYIKYRLLCYSIKFYEIKKSYAKK